MKRTAHVLSSGETPGTRLQALRGARGWTQDDVAERAKISKSFLSELENGHAMPGGDVVLRLAEIFGTSTDYILRGTTATATRAIEPVAIPPELAALAQEMDLSYRQMMALHDARQSVIARRGKPDARIWSQEDWRKLYDRLKDYLE